MPRFFFHIRGGEIECEDEEGLDLPDDGAAQKEAIRSARHLLAAAVLEGQLPLEESIVVADDGGGTITTVTFGEAVGNRPR